MRDPRSSSIAFTSALVTLAGALAVAGCGEAPGTLEVRIYGEDFIEQGIPAAAFHDQWSVKFSRFLVAAGELTAARGTTAAMSDPGLRIFDLTRPSSGRGHLVTTAAVDGGRYDRISYRIAPPPAAARPGNATVADRDLLVARGCALLADGSATKQTITKRFAWCLPTKTRYHHCESTALVDGNTAAAQLTVHADHLFYDDLFAAEPRVAFDLIALGDANDDGEVTEAELRAVDITREERYQVGSEKITNLWDFIAFLSATVGHIDGEGHCETARE